MRRRDRMTSQPDSPAGLSFERDDGTMPCDGAWPAGARRSLPALDRQRAGALTHTN